jgi:hypothetical protein
MKTGGKVELRLFASDSLISARTVYHWLEILEGFPKDAYVLRVRDVSAASTAVSQLELDAYGVAFTPCMVARGDGRTARIIGELATPEARKTAVARLRAVGLVPLARDRQAG